MASVALHVALLRAINVAGHNAVAMSALRKLFGDLGYTDVTTLLQSGNLVFRGGRRSGASLERFLEGETVRRLGLAADYIVRTAGEWGEIVARNPFPEQAKADPGHLVVMIMKS